MRDRERASPSLSSIRFVTAFGVKWIAYVYPFSSSHAGSSRPEKPPSKRMYLMLRLVWRARLLFPGRPATDSRTKTPDPICDCRFGGREAGVYRLVGRSEQLVCTR